MPRAPSTAKSSPKKVRKATVKTAASERPKRVIPKPKPVTAPTKKIVKKKVSNTKADKAKTSSKKASTKKNVSKVARKTKPTYEKMIFKSIKELGGRNQSGIAIAKYIVSNYPVHTDTYKRFVRVALKKAVENGLLIQTKGSYKISAKAKELNKRKPRSSTKKSTSPKRKSNSTKTRSVSPKSPKKSPKKSSKAESSDDKTTKKRSLSEVTEKAPKKARSTTVTAETIDAPRKPVGLKSDYIWQYQDNTWRNYATEASNVVEDVYQAYLANRGDTDVRAVRSGDWEYMVDFMAMKQTNIQHQNHTVRNIRRVKTLSS